MNFSNVTQRTDVKIFHYEPTNHIGFHSIGLAASFAMTDYKYVPNAAHLVTWDKKFYVDKEIVADKIEAAKIIDMRFMREFKTLSDAKRYSDKVYKRNNKFYVSRCHVALKRRQLLNWVTGLDEGRDFASSTIATIESVYGWMDKDEIIQVVKNTSRNVTRSQGFRDGVDSVLIDYTWNLGRYKA